MWGWIQEQNGEPFVLFSTSHMIIILLYFVGFISLIICGKRIINNPRLYRVIRWGFFGILVGSELTYQLYAHINNIWSMQKFIPFHLCGVASIVAAIALITHNKRLIIIAYFIGVIPALMALITPELPYDYPHFRYWKFFIHHLTISWACVFLVVTQRLKITFFDTLFAYGVLLIYAAFIGFIINPTLQSNYLFLSSTPSNNTPLDLLGNGVSYYVNLCLVGLLVFIGMYGLYNWWYRCIMKK